MYNANNQKERQWIKRLALALMLVVAMALLSGCYTPGQSHAAQLRADRLLVDNTFGLKEAIRRGITGTFSGLTLDM